MPFKSTEESACFDLCTPEEIDYSKADYLGRVKIGLGFAASMPPGWVCFILPKSGLTLKGMQTAKEAPASWFVQTGVIDADYRGEWCVLVVTNMADHETIPKGTKIAQAYFQRVPRVTFGEVDKLDHTARGTGGFGSTGLGCSLKRYGRGEK